MVDIYVNRYFVPSKFRSKRKQKNYEDNLRKSKITLKNGTVKENLNFNEYQELSRNEEDIEKFEYDRKDFSDFNLFDKEIRKEKNIKEEREAKLRQINKNKEN